MNPKLRKVERLYSAASDLLLEIVEEEARRMLREHPELEEFIMCMGSWFFTVKDSDEHEDGFIEHHSSSSHSVFHYSSKEGWEDFHAIFGEWNEYFKLTGEPIRFTADGPVIRNW